MCVIKLLASAPVPKKSYDKIIVALFSGIAKLAFSDENVGFTSGFFQIISPQLAQGNKN